MQRVETFPNVRFSVATIVDAVHEFSRFSPAVPQEGHYEISRDTSTWQFDSLNEFYAEYRSGCTRAHLKLPAGDGREISVLLDESKAESIVAVRCPTRADIEAVFWIFYRDAASAKVSIPPGWAKERPVVFVGHGRSLDWRDLKDHLVDKHQYAVDAYETGARSGHSIRDILDQLLESSSFAILVLTAEDEQPTKKYRARQNVVHELGLFQGRLGYPRAIAVVEEGVELFSNMDGVQQIRFAKGNISSTYGEVLATLRREFGDAR